MNDEFGKSRHSAFRVGFLVSDSRSGSTLLAALITSRLRGCVVTPELRFNRLLKLPDSELKKMSANRLARLLTENGQLRNLAASDSVLGCALEEKGHFAAKADVVRFVLRLHFEAGAAELPDLALVKAGSHLLQWRAIQSEFPDAPFVHIVRDPRGVVNSKQRSARPYAPWETLGWSGPFLMALRWRQYVAAADRAGRSGVSVTRVHFEELLHDESTVMTKLAAFLGAEIVGRGSGEAGYAIPQAEQGIHSLVGLEKPVRARAGAWKSELSRRDVLCVEFLAGSAMESHGYERTNRSTAAASALALVAGFCKSLTGVVRHFLVARFKSLRRRTSARTTPT